MAKLDDIKKEYQKITEQLSSQEVISDPQKLQELSKKQSKLQEVVDIAAELDKTKKKIEENENIVSEENDDELKQMAAEELDPLREKQKELENKLQDKLYPEPGADIKEAIVEVRAGVGGEEAALFAQDLFRMYTRYAENKNWSVNVLDQSTSDLQGIKEAVFEIKGEGVYNTLKNESGVHRVQRVPETEKGGRVHTSTASVAVLPKAKPVDIEIKPDDIKFEAFRSSGPGGQNVNKVATAVRITHLPTGISVASQTAKSQAQNRQIAMTILRSKLLKKKQEEEEARIRKQRSKQIGSAERSEKIRTYNFPQDRVTDHRAGKSWHGIDAIMDGNLEKLIKEVKTILRKQQTEE